MVMIVYSPEKRASTYLLFQQPYIENITEDKCSIKASGQLRQTDDLLCPPQTANAVVLLAYDE